MAVHYKATGFIFKKEDRLDADRVFSVFTKEFGRVEIAGKAIRKMASKLRGGMELFYISNIEFVQGKNKKTLTDAVVVESFNAIYDSPEKMELAGTISSMVDQFIVGEQKDEQILDLIKGTFVILRQFPARQLLYFYFFWNFVALLGYAPDQKKLPADAAAMISKIMERDWQKLAALQPTLPAQKSLAAVTAHYYSYLLEQAGKRKIHE